MNKIEIKSAVKDLAEKFYTYNREPFEGRQTFSHTFNGRTVELTLEKDKKIMGFILNNFGKIEKDATYKFKFTDAPKRKYNYAKISFSPNSKEDWISGEELRVFLKAVFKQGIMAQISITNPDFGKFISLDHAYAKDVQSLGSPEDEQSVCQEQSCNLVDASTRVQKILSTVIFSDVERVFPNFPEAILDQAYVMLSDLEKQWIVASYLNRLQNRETVTFAGKVLSQL